VSTLPFAISTQLYRDATLCRDHLVEIAAHGFERIELFANRPHIDTADARAVGELAEALGDTELVVHSVHAPIAESLAGRRWGPALSIAHGDAAARARAVQEVEATVALAARLRAGIVVVHVGVPDSLPPAANDNRADAVRRSLERLQEVAEGANVALALEVIPNRLSTPDALVHFIEDDLDLPGLGICLDFGHANLGGGVLDAIETASGHVITTHVHDNAGKSDDHLLPFEGRIGWDAALMALQKIGYDGALVFELAASIEPRAVLERAQRVRARFEELLGASAL
jgi:sugar phosphate isomerase/epimerase